MLAKFKCGNNLNCSAKSYFIGNNSLWKCPLKGIPAINRKRYFKTRPFLSEDTCFKSGVILSNQYIQQTNPQRKYNSRKPLWKQDVPRFPLYYKGDPKHKVFLPLFWMKVIPPEEKVPPDHVHFMVHPQMSKGDIKQYLEKIYNVSVLNVRTELRRRDVRANQYSKWKLQDNKITVWREEDKYAYVQLKSGTFEYPDFFEKGKTLTTEDSKEKKGGETEGMKDRLKYEKEAAKMGRKISLKTRGFGLPPWFTGI